MPRARGDPRGAPHAYRQRSRRASSARRSAPRFTRTATTASRPSAGPHEMAALDRADALAFYDRYYTPNNAIVVVAGDVTEDEVRTLAEATYGKVAAPRRTAAARPRHGAASRSPRAPSPSPIRASPSRPPPLLSRARPTPTRHAGEAEALDVLAEILGGGTTSRLYRRSSSASARRHLRRRRLSAPPRSMTPSSAVYAVPRGDIDARCSSPAGIDGVIADVARQRRHRRRTGPRQAAHAGRRHLRPGQPGLARPRLRRRP